MPDFDPAQLDLDEIVTLLVGGRLKLCAAVARVMAKPERERFGVAIFRAEEPPIRNLAEIEVIAARPDFKGQD